MDDKRDLRDASILWLSHAGVPVWQIAAAVGCSIKTISNLRVRAGLASEARQKAGRENRKLRRPTPNAGPRPPSVRAAISKGRSGIRNPEEAYAAMADWRRGKPLSAEHRQAISAGLTGRTLTEEHKAAIAASSGDRAPWTLGPQSREHRKALAASVAAAWERKFAKAAPTPQDQGTREDEH